MRSLKKATIFFVAILLLFILSFVSAELDKRDPQAPGDAPPAGGNPPAAGGNPPAAGGDNPPAAGGNPPAAGGDNPPVAGGKAPAGGNPPAAGGDNPPAAGGKAPAGGNPPAAGGDNPPAAGGKAPAGGNPPAGGDNPPVAGGKAPAGGNPPAGGGNPPAAGGKAPAGGAPAAGGKVPVGGTTGTNDTASTQPINVNPLTPSVQVTMVDPKLSTKNILYKIGSNITFKWTYSAKFANPPKSISAYAQPEVDTKTYYPIALNQTLNETLQVATWVTADNASSLPMAKYKLWVCDERGLVAAATPGGLQVFSGLEFGLYKPQDNNDNCPTCTINSAVSISIIPLLSTIGFTLITIISFNFILI